MLTFIVLKRLAILFKPSPNKESYGLFSGRMGYGIKVKTLRDSFGRSDGSENWIS